MSGKGRRLVEPVSVACGLLQCQGPGEPLSRGELCVLGTGQGVQGHKQIPEQWGVGAAVFPTLWLQPRPWKVCAVAWQLLAARVQQSLAL